MIIAVIGSGRKLGSAICKELEKNNKLLKFDKEDNFGIVQLKQADIAVDASVHTNTLAVAQCCAISKIPLLVCTTGHTKSEIKKIEKLKKQTKICMCPNLSVGINKIVEWLENSKFENCKVSIFERHHINKKDAPSGTALWLKNVVSHIDNNPEIVSSRFGDDVGTHVVTLDMPHEQITIIHKAKDRSVFALGAKYKIENFLKENSAHEN